MFYSINSYKSLFLFLKTDFAVSEIPENHDKLQTSPKKQEMYGCITKFIENKYLSEVNDVKTDCKSGLNVLKGECVANGLVGEHSSLNTDTKAPYNGTGDMFLSKNLKELNKFQNLNEDETTFIGKYGEVVSGLSNSLGLDKSVIYSLIKRESNFIITNKSGTGSTGVMQLTGSVFNDMNDGKKGRPERYTSYFDKVPDDLINKIEGKNKDVLISALKRAKLGDMKGFASLNTRENKNNPVFNLILGSVYLKTLKETSNDNVPKGMKNVSFREVNRLLASKNISVSREDFNNLKSSLISGNNKEGVKYYNACANYNGDGRHKYVYAFAVLLGKEKRN